MKIVKGFCILVISVVLGSCFDPPEFPNVPQIEFESVQFKRGPTVNDPDSLILTVSFKDGDGDLGIDPANPQFISYPYNNLIFYRTSSNGALIPINTVAGIYNGDTLNVLDIVGAPGENLGELVYPRTKKENPLYSNLPQYHCSEYEYLLSANLWLHQSAVSLLDADPSDQIVDTVNIPNYGTFYQLQDTIHIDVNPNHYNIEVDFLEYAPGTEGAGADGYREYDWRKEFCQSFDGRFPVLSGDDNALEGNIRYSMNSLGFRFIFGGKTLKLRATVRDRALHQSNTIETNPFTVQ